MNFIRIAIIAGLILTFLISLAAYPVAPGSNHLSRERRG